MLDMEVGFHQYNRKLNLTVVTFETMNSALSAHDIATACRLLFGRTVQVTPEFLASMDPHQLRDTFRQRAMELHPDRAGLLGGDAAAMGEMFKEVKEAYEQLSGMTSESAGLVTAAGTVAPPGAGPGVDHYWAADIPPCRLLFGQFLYYTGLVSWRTLIDAVVWQRSMRPPFGRIATMWNYLGKEAVGSILARRNPGELFGEAARRQGYLNRFQAEAVLGLQKWLQRPIGEYFQEIGLLETEEINYLIGLMKKHNRRSCDP